MPYETKHEGYLGPITVKTEGEFKLLPYGRMPEPSMAVTVRFATPIATTGKAARLPMMRVSVYDNSQYISRPVQPLYWFWEYFWEKGGKQEPMRRNLHRDGLEQAAVAACVKHATAHPEYWERAMLEGRRLEIDWHNAAIKQAEEAISELVHKAAAKLAGAPQEA